MKKVSMAMEMDKRKLILVILLIAAGVVFQILIQDGFSLFSNKTEYKLIDKEFPNDYILKREQFKSVSAIDLDNFAGNVLVERSNNEYNYIDITIRVFHKNKEEAIKIRNATSVSLKKTEDILKILSATRKELQYNRVRVNFRIELSDKSMIKINNSNGIINVSKTNTPLNISNINGEIKLSEIKGKIYIKKALENNITILNCSDIKANLFNSTTTIVNSSGDIELFSKGGKVKITSINNKKNLRIISKQSRISLSKIKNNNVNIQIYYEDVFVKNLSSANIDFFLKNSNLVFNPISENNINKTSINAIDSQILLKFNPDISPKYTIDLTYGNIIGDISKLIINKNNHKTHVISTKGKPDIIIKGEYTDVKIVKKKQP